uniref:AbiTii domain-containing protein n=1 Tax=candidate division WOR-3 bacterium TaxID=2052148 RepID=A0A7C6EBS6_UNCW3
MAENLIAEIIELAQDILTECKNRADYDLIAIFQKLLHLARLVKARSYELWSLSELEGYQSETVLKELKRLSKQETIEYNSLRRLRSFPDDCFLQSLKDQFLVTGELLATDPGRATLTMPLKELEMSYLTDREYYKQIYSMTAPLSLSLLERAFTQMKNRVYIFASEIYLRYRLAQNIAGIFDDRINSVNQRLARLCPKVLNHLNQALEFRIIDRSQALINLSAALKEFAAFLLPTEKTTDFELSDQFFINRICQFLEENLAKEKAVLLKTNYRFLIHRIEAIYQRIKTPPKIKSAEVEPLILETYLWLSDALDLIH